jgi:hypothetical protein
MRPFDWCHFYAPQITRFRENAIYARTFFKNSEKSHIKSHVVGPNLVLGPAVCVLLGQWHVLFRVMPFPHAKNRTFCAKLLFLFLAKCDLRLIARPTRTALGPGEHVVWG